MGAERAVDHIPATEVPEGAFLLDVREPAEWAAGHVPGAMHIPMSQLNARYQEIGRDSEVYVICRSGARSAQVAQALAGAGWDARNVADGMIGWHAAGRPMAADSGTPYVA
jgi:rhodanese-related sulfurtransferase